MRLTLLTVIVTLIPISAGFVTVTVLLSFLTPVEYRELVSLNMDFSNKRLMLVAGATYGYSFAAFCSVLMSLSTGRWIVRRIKKVEKTITLYFRREPLRKPLLGSDEIALLDKLIFKLSNESKEAGS